MDGFRRFIRSSHGFCWLWSIDLIVLYIIRSLNVKQPAESIHSLLSTFDSEEIAWDVYIWVYIWYVWYSTVFMYAAFACLALFIYTWPLSLWIFGTKSEKWKLCCFTLDWGTSQESPTNGLFQTYGAPTKAIFTKMSSLAICWFVRVLWKGLIHAGRKNAWVVMFEIMLCSLCWSKKI